MRRFLLLTALALTFLCPVRAQEYASTAEDIALAEMVMQELAAAPQQAPGAQMVLAARRLLAAHPEPQPGIIRASQMLLDRAQAIVAAAGAFFPKPQLPQRQGEVVGNHQNVFFADVGEPAKHLPRQIHERLRLDQERFRRGNAGAEVVVFLGPLA